jgi:hypothetical protein
MVRVESSFTLEKLMEFAKQTYEAFSVKSRLRKHAYYRQVAAYIAIEGGYKVGEVAKALGVSHPTIVWSRENATSRLTSREEEFLPYYNDFVDKFNKYLNTETSNEFLTTVNEGESVNA